MNKFNYLLAVGGMALAACTSGNNYRITGTVEGAQEGDVVYLQEYVNRELVKVDSAIVRNGEFTFTGQQDSTVSRFLTYTKDDVHYVTDFFLENGKITATLGESCNVDGTPNNQVYQQFKDQYKVLNDEMRELYTRARKDSTLTAEQKDELMKQLDSKDSIAMDLAYTTIKTNIASAVGAALLPDYAPAFSHEQQKELLGLLPEKFQNGERIARLRDHVETVEKTSEGKHFIDFTLNSPEGEPVTLSDIIAQNEYTLIDFWASWCGPCRAEMPNVVAAYQQYKAKGFGIVGVSLDNNADKWKEAITNLNITWAQMSDLKGWDNEAAKLYGVNSIPATVLVNREGIIIARNLRGEAIAEKLESLFSESAAQ
jgi:thiol-disulfide isomerase/thioredoxin